MTDNFIDFDEPLFGDLTKYKKLSLKLMESLKIAIDSISDDTFNKDNTIFSNMVFDITDLLMDTMDNISDNLYSNELIVHEFPLFVEAKEIIDYVLMYPFNISLTKLDLAMDIFSDFFTLLEVKLILFQNCPYEIAASDNVLEEYDKELNNFMERFSNYRDKFISFTDDDF